MSRPGQAAPDWLHQEVSGPSKSTDHDPVVSIKVPTRGPYGVLLEDDGAGCSAVVKAFERLPSGKFGPIQKHGGVRVGDVLVGINEVWFSKECERTNGRTNERASRSSIGGA